MVGGPSIKESDNNQDLSVSFIQAPVVWLKVGWVDVHQGSTGSGVSHIWL